MSSVANSDARVCVGKGSGKHFNKQETGEDWSQDTDLLYFICNKEGFRHIIIMNQSSHHNIMERTNQSNEVGRTTWFSKDGPEA